MRLDKWTDALLAVAFGVLLAIELIAVAIVTGLVGLLIVLLWERSPWIATAAAAGLIGCLIWFWRNRGREVAEAAPGQVHRGILLDRIPVSGAAGSMYMLQFLVWALASPVVGVGFAVLIAAGILLVPVAYHYNRPRKDGLVRVGGAGALGAIFGLGFFLVVSARQVPFAAMFGAATAAGTLGAVVLLWRRAKQGRNALHVVEE